MVAYYKQKKKDYIKVIAWNIIDDRLLHVQHLTMSLHVHNTFAHFVNAWKLIILWKKKKGQKENHTSSLLKRAWKLVRYSRCFSKHGLCLHLTSFFQQILVSCPLQILCLKGFIIHLSICYHIFPDSFFSQHTQKAAWGPPVFWSICNVLLSSIPIWKSVFLFIFYCFHS